MWANINSVAIPPSQNITIIKNTTNINNITIVNNRVINNGPGVSIVERATGVRVHEVNVIENNVDPQAVVKGSAKINRLEGSNLYVFRPSVVKKGNEAPHLTKEGNIKGGGNNQPPVQEERKVTNPSGQTEKKKEEQ